MSVLMLGAAGGAALAGYEALKLGINKSGIDQFVGKHLPEPVAQYFTPVVAGGLTIAAAGVAASYAGVGAAGASAGGVSTLAMNTDKIVDQVAGLGKMLSSIVFGGGSNYSVSSIASNAADVISNSIELKSTEIPGCSNVRVIGDTAGNGIKATVEFVFGIE